ncbi:dual specificity protein phosphatase 19 isoform X3 [Equus przewalskii]|uniref:Dual specificity protein phosphatase 19 isoform X3 n=1 Tax=Equus przewalskii TaxID=9798 RepID=A0ABM2EUQ4_EQUPR|nr:dual specificity protein phosphatase 19 isoform X3 [Equus caballus]XP_008521918.1 PREDICTED: dual specificity protein phosphatase 19 isoform X3 [Equus przewalskii]
MHSLNQEIKAFSRNNLRKQCTRVTTLSGKKIIETWKDARIYVVEEVEASSGGGCGYVQDVSLDLQVGVIKPWLLLGSQDAAHDLDTLKKHKVKKNASECFEFIEQVKMKDGVVLVHCNAGVSRAAAIVIGFLMNSDEISFTSAFSLVKNARPSICPNAGFMEQLRTYQEGKESHKCDKIQELEGDNRS